SGSRHNMLKHARMHQRGTIRNALSLAFRKDLFMAGSVPDPRPGGSMTHKEAVSRASEIADRVLAPAAADNDKAGRFSTEAVAALGRTGLLGLMLPAESGGAGLGPRT